MPASLKARLYTAAAANAPLVALLTSGPTFQWGDQQLPQQWNLTTCNAVLVTIISDPRTYATGGRLPTSFTRVQFSVFGFGSDSTQAAAVVAALLDFLDGFNAGQASSTGTPGPNYVLNDRDSGFVQTQPMTYQRILDVRIFNNDSF